MARRRFFYVTCTLLLTSHPISVFGRGHSRKILRTRSNRVVTLIKQVEHQCLHRAL